MRDYKYSNRLDEWTIYGEDIQKILDHIDEVYEENKENYSQDCWDWFEKYQKKNNRSLLGKKNIPIKIFSNVWMRVVHKHFPHYYRNDGYFGSNGYNNILSTLGERWENRLYKLYLKR